MNMANVNSALLCVLFCMAHAQQYVQVIEFPTRSFNGSSSNDGIDEVNLENAVATKEITGCVRFMLRYSRGYQLINNGQIVIWLYEVHLNIGFINIRPKTALNAGDLHTEGYSRMFRFCKPYVPGQWISFCFATKFTGSSQELKVIQDGKLCTERIFDDGEIGFMYFKQPLLPKDIIYTGGSVAEENPHGKLTHFNLWSRQLSTDEMISFTQNCRNSLNKDGILFDWNNVTNQSGDRNLPMHEEPIHNVCEGKDFLPVEIAREFPYLKGKHLCKKLGGEMSMELPKEGGFKIGDQTLSCTKCEGERIYWLPVVQGRLVAGQKEKYEWVDDRQDKNHSKIQSTRWIRSQPNGLDVQQCVEARPTVSGIPRWNDQACTFARFLTCEMPRYQTYYLRGSNPKDFDEEYTLSLELQTSSSAIEFVGQRKSKLIWYPMKDRAKLVNHNKNLTIAINQNPFGLIDAQHLNGPESFNATRMVFTNCDPKHNFTCWDGQCISIDKRCDLIDDCPDRSDEHMCRYIKIDKARYRDVFPPIPPNGEKLKVSVGFVLFDIVDIDEPKMIFTAKFNINLEWKDYGLSFQSLRDDYEKNLILDYMADNIWKPNLIFENNHQREIIKYVPSSSVMMIIKKGNSTEAPLSQLDEARVYESSDTGILMRTKHFLDFKCLFDLTYFPFDNQKCYIKLKMPRDKESALELKAGSMNQEYNAVLNEFLITDTFIAESAGNTNVSLVILLERRQLSYFISIFLPTLCLVLAAEITLFIDEMHFQATIMVALTSNLVMYTLYNAIGDELPADSTLKLIDVWLLHGLIMPMVVFIILAINELIQSRANKSNAEVQPSEVSETSKEGLPLKGGKSENWISGLGKGKCEKRRSDSFIKVARVIIPTSSILFTLAFFAIGLNAPTADCS